MATILVALSQKYVCLVYSSMRSPKETHATSTLGSLN